MRKKLCIVAALVMTLLFAVNVSAKNISTFTADLKDGSIVVRGTTPEETYAVQILVYDSKADNAKLVATKSVAVSDDNTFSDTIQVQGDSFYVKAADYNGGYFLTQSVGKAAEEEEKRKEAEKRDKENGARTDSDKRTPKTGEI